VERRDIQKEGKKKKKKISCVRRGDELLPLRRANRNINERKNVMMPIGKKKGVTVSENEEKGEPMAIAIK